MGVERISFDGYLMEMEEAGTKDSEGEFTLTASKAVERLREQFAQAPLLGYTELFQGFRALEATSVTIETRAPEEIRLSASFRGRGPNLTTLLENPLSILSADHGLHSGTGLLLLRHEQDRVWWSCCRGSRWEHWRYRSSEGQFVKDTGPDEESRSTSVTTWRFTLRVEDGGLKYLYPFHRDERWRWSPLTNELIAKLAFYGLPVTCDGRAVQSPIPGRLVPQDVLRQHRGGPLGSNWEPLAYELLAGCSRKSTSFLSEPFSGTISDIIFVDGTFHRGYGDGCYPDFVSFKSQGRTDVTCEVPFRRRRFFGGSLLKAPGFEAMPSRLINSRMEGGWLNPESSGQSLYCSRLIMLSVALKGPSAVAFLQHGVLLGASYEDLGVPGTLCLIDTEGLSTDLSRRAIRRDKAYLARLEELRAACLAFAQEATEVFSEEQWAGRALREALRECSGT